MKQQLPFYTLLLFLFVLSSCENEKNKSLEDTNKKTESPIIDHSTSQNSLDYVGVYQGKIPCADCEGIYIKLVIEEDNKFVRSSKYIGKSEEVFVETGTYRWNNTGSTIYLTNENNQDQGYVVKENMLVMLDQEGNTIKGALQEKYTLQKEGF